MNLVKQLNRFVHVKTSDLNEMVPLIMPSWPTPPAKAGVDGADVDELYMGQARQLGSGPNPARQVSIKAGCGEGAVATTINKACGSSLKAIDLARAAILLDGHGFVD